MAAAAHDAHDPWGFLWINRTTRLVRYACTRSGDIWVHGDLPVAAIDAREVDRFLGLVVEGAVAARHAVADRKAPPDDGAGEGWGALA